MSGTRQPHGQFDPSVNLVYQAQEHLRFLKDVNDNSRAFSQPCVIANAIRRYETCWLPLVTTNKNENLLPPLDVHWVWHVHMLSPQKYYEDMKKITGSLVNHTFFTQDEETLPAEMTKILWETSFPEEPYDISFDDISNSFNYEPKQIEYDIQGASSRQLEFYYNVSLPHYQNTPFLKTAEDRYKKFMYLKQLNNDAYLVPMYDIDLIWHTHQLSPCAYFKDCKTYLGFVLNHDDTTTDRSPGSYLNESYENTRKLWQETFQEHYAIPGVAYRGPDPSRKLIRVDSGDIKKYIAKEARARLDRFSYHSRKKTKKVRGSLKLFYHNGNANKCENIKLQTMKEDPFEWTSDQPSGLSVLQVSPGMNLQFKVRLRSFKAVLSSLVNGTKVFQSTLDVTDQLRKAVDRGQRMAFIEQTNVKAGTIKMRFSIWDPQITDIAE